VIRRAAPLLAAAFVLAGCNGGTVDRSDLENDNKTMDSIACEGALVAHGIARDRTWTFYAREQAEELRIQSANLADAFARRPVAAGLDAATRKARERAASLARMLDYLNRHPTDDAGARDVETFLKKNGNCP
jgi:hypothetical protein